MKKCSKCQEELPLDSYFKYKGKPRYWCKKCDTNNMVLRMKVFKEQCVEYKGGKCEMCGYNYSYAALEFHHKNPKEKEFALSKIKQRNFDHPSVKKELDKCVLICSNCHRELHEKHDVVDLLEHHENYLNLRKSKSLETNRKYICECGNKKGYKSEKCIDCKNKTSNERIPEDVLKMVKEQGLEATGRFYGVTGNAIKKYLKIRNLL